MYQPDIGTWFSMTIKVIKSGEISATFAYDEPPSFITEPVAEAYAQDARRFPRNDAHIPRRLKERLIEADTTRRGQAGP